jgi:phage gp16-like protein
MCRAEELKAMIANLEKSGEKSNCSQEQKADTYNYSSVVAHKSSNVSDIFILPP